MKRLAGASALILLAATTSGCSWLWGDEGYFRDRGRDYQAANQQPAMQVPAGLETRPLDPLLPIPSQIARLDQPGEFEVPRPPKVQVRTAEQGESVSLSRAQEYSAPEQASLLIGPTGQPLLQLDTDFDRAWASIGRALRAADVRVDDLNRSLGIYYVNLAEEAREPGERPGFFARLFGADEVDEAEAERYQVRVVEIAERVQVLVEQEKDMPVPADEARRILTLIQDNLG